MAEIILDSEVREIAQVDWENPLSDYLVAALLPNQGSGNELTELVTLDSSIYPDTVVWNGDGSITKTSTVSSHITAATIPALNDSEVFILVDLDRGGSVANRESLVVSLFGSTVDYLDLRNGAYSTGEVYVKGVLNNGTANTGFTGSANAERALYGVHYKAALGSWDIYKNGVIVASQTGRAINPWGDDVTIRLGLSTELDKLYSSQVLVKSGSFTPEEILSLNENPYQTFKTRDKVAQEYGLVCTTNQRVNADAWNPTTLDFSFSFTFIAGSVVRNILGSDHTQGIYIRVDGNQQLYVWYNNKSLYSVSKAYTFTDGIEYTIKGIVYANGDSEVVVNNVSFYTATNSIVLGTSAGLTTINYTDFAPTEYSNFTALLLVLNDPYDSTNSRYWEFNQTYGEQVIDHYNGAIATLVGFSADRGYVRGYGVSDGLTFNDVSAQYVSLPKAIFTGDFSFTLGINFLNADGNSRFLTSEDTIDPTTIELYHHSSGVIVIFYGQASIGQTTAKYFDIPAIITLSRTGTELTLNVNGSDDLVITESGILTMSRVGKRDGYNSSLSTYRSLAIDNTAFYDFTKITSNTTVPETINGNDGTLVGFNDVYVPEKNKTLVGQEFDGVGTKVAVPLTDFPKFSSNIRKGVFEFKAHIAQGDTRLGICKGVELRETALYLDGEYAPISKPFSTDVVYRVEIDLVYGVSAETKVYENNVLVHTYASYLNIKTTDLGLAFAYRKGVIEYVSFNDLNVPSLTRYYDFSIESGNTITDTSGNGNHGTVVGGSLRRIYDYSGYGEVVGYKTQQDTPNGFQFRGLPVNPLTIKIYITGDFNNIYNNSSNWTALYDGRVVSGSGYLYLTTSNAVEPLGNGAIQGVTNVMLNGVDIGASVAAGEGVGKVFHAKAGDLIQFEATGHLGNFNLMMSNTGVASCNGVIGKVEVFDGAVLVANYDFTTGDQGKIVETISGNHAVITNAATDKWQPIVPVDVFTIGSAVGLDYSTVYAYEAAVVNIDSHKIGYVYGDTGESATIAVTDQLGIFELRSAKGQEADFKGGGARLGTSILQMARSRTVTRGLNLARYSAIYADVTSDDSVYDCHIDSGGVGIGIEFLNSKLLLKNTLISNNNRGAYSSVSTTIPKFLSCLFVNNGDINCLRANYQDCISIGATNVDFYGVSLGSNNISSDSSATDLAIGTGSVDFTGAFVDEANGDYRINDAWATANLKGKGWNGSDIASFAYAIISTTITLNYNELSVSCGIGIMSINTYTTIDLNPITVNVSIDSLTPNRKTSLLFNGLVINALVGQFNISLSSLLSFNSLTVNTLVDNVDLVLHGSITYNDISIQSSIDVFDISRNTSIVYNDLTVSSSIDVFDISRNTSIVYNDLLVYTSIDGIDLVLHSSITYNDITVSSMIDDINITINNPLAIGLSYNDLIVSSSIDVFDISRNTSIVYNDISISSTIDSMDLLRNSSLSYNDLAVITSLDDITLQVNKPLQFNDIVVDTSIDDIVINKQTSLQFNELFISSSLNDINISKNSLLVFNDIDVQSSIDVFDINRFVVLEFNTNTSPTSLDAYNIIRYTSIVYNDLVVTSAIDNLSVVTKRMQTFSNNNRISIISLTSSYSLRLIQI